MKSPRTAAKVNPYDVARGLIEDVAAHRIEHDVSAATAGDFQFAIPKSALAVIDGMIGAVPFHRFDPPFASSGRDEPSCCPADKPHLTWLEGVPHGDDQAIGNPCNHCTVAAKSSYMRPGRCRRDLRRSRHCYSRLKGGGCRRLRRR
jgi:hypothetical protein